MERAGKLIRGLKSPGGCVSDEALVRAAWPQAVGPKIAAHTRPVALVSSRLIVEVEDAIWQRQLEAVCGQILPRLGKLAGRESVAAIEFRIGIPRRAPQRAEKAHAESDEADGIADPVLRRLYKTARKRSTA
jgi:predicted nucleic acid-binding Zn ribbon protein